jgi:hypothetical protein
LEPFRAGSGADIAKLSRADTAGRRVFEHAGAMIEMLANERTLVLLAAECQLNAAIPAIAT